MAIGSPILPTDWQLDVAPLVPEEYAVYRPVVVDALMFFITHLSPERQRKIFAAQQQLSPEASLSQRLASLMCQCPTLHKLGQIIAHDHRLTPSLRWRLQALESMEPTTPMATITPTIRYELGAQSWSSITLGSKPLAEASVAVVLPFSMSSIESKEPYAGVLKVLKPEVEALLEEELAVWSRLGAFIDERCEHYAAPALHYAQTLEAVRDLLSNEIRLDLEQQHLRAASALYADAESVQIPEVLPCCTARITAMQQIHGTKVTNLEHLPQHTRCRIANTIIEALIARPLWTASPIAMFHADPHAGNLFFTDEGRIAILDWSLVGHLGEAERTQTIQLMLGALTLDASRIVEAVAALAEVPPDESRLRALVQRALRRLCPGRLPGFHWLMGLMDEAVLSMGVRFGEALLLFRKSILTIEGLLMDVCPESSIDTFLPLTAAIQFYREWPQRAFASPVSRHFGTHVSNLDLWSLYWGIPTTAARFWVELWTHGLSGRSH